LQVVHGELLNQARFTMPNATVPRCLGPAVDAGVAGPFGAERFEKELLVERLLDVELH